MRVGGVADYHLSSKRLAELRNFSYQYDDWRDELAAITEISSVNIDGLPHGTAISDPVATVAAAREKYKDKIALVDYCIDACTDDDNLRRAVRIAVTTPRTSFQSLKSRGILYWERDKYYQALHRYYWILDKYRA